jgi:acetate kinase
VSAHPAVLVLNTGSSSLKASLFDADGLCLRHETRSWPAATATDDPDALHRALDEWLPGLLGSDHGGLQLVGHRVVHGGERFHRPTRLTEDVLRAIEELVPLAPLHNGPALLPMRWMASWKPELEQWVCFDTAFHATLSEEAYTYPLPGGWRRMGLRRYGFHGLNHQHISEVVTQHFGAHSAATAEPLKLISCHLGAGCSLCAIKGGRSVDTTMGFTPLEGLMMGTRSGSVDPGLILHLLRHGIGEQQLDHALNSESGLLGLSELSSDMRELRLAASKGHRGAQLAIAVFRHRLCQGIGAMAATLGGVDVIALTGGIGEHDQELGRELEQEMAWLRPFDLIRIPADEEGLIARSCMARARAQADRADLAA